MKTPNFAYVRARSLKEAAAHLSSKGARVHAEEPTCSAASATECWRPKRS